MLVRDNGIPYYRQLIDIIQQQIEKGILQEGEQIASETELSATYQVNRHTIRQAVSELCRCGVLYKLKGRGTFVARRLNFLEYKMAFQNQFADNILKIGQTPSSKVLRAAEISAPPAISEILSVNLSDSIYVLEVLRLVNGKPFLVTTNFIPAKYMPGFLEKIADFTSLSAIYKECYGIIMERVNSVFRASFPNTQEAAALDIPINMPVIKVDNLLKSQDGILMQYNVTCYRGDIAKVSIDW